MGSDTTELKIAVEQGSSWSRRLSITVPADRVRRTRGKVAEQIAQGVRLPGFRKGKLPQRVIEQRFGPSIDQETIDRLVQEAYREALESEGIIPIDRGRIDDVKYDPAAEMTFEVEVEVRPEIELARLDGFTASRPPAQVTDADVDAVIERLRDERATWVPIEAGSRPAYGDQVLIDITSLDGDEADGEEAGSEDEEPNSYRIRLGEGQAIGGVEDAVLTLAPGETGEFSVAFPDDFPDESRRGQEQRLRITLQEAERKELPELDENFVREVGEFDSLEAFRERARTDLEADAEQRSEADVRRQLIDQLVDANPFEVPESMIRRYVSYTLGEPQTDEEREKMGPLSPEQEEQLEQLRQELRPQAERGLKRTLAIEAIAQAEGLNATQDEIDVKVEELAERHGQTASAVWLQLEKSGQLEALEREITEDKVFEFLKSRNTIA